MFTRKEYLNTTSDDTLLWRYMDLTKLLSILETEKLFFPTINSLQAGDPWEGSLSTLEFAQYIGGTEESQKEVKEIHMEMIKRDSENRYKKLK